MPIHAQLLRHATETPDKPALVIDGRSLSYGELYVRAKVIYRFLRDMPRSKRRTLDLPGVEKLAALSLGNHIAFAEYFAATTAYPNACAVIDPTMPAERIERIIERLVPDVLIVDDDAGPSADIARRLGIPVIAAGAEAFDLASTDGAAELPIDADKIFLIGFTSGTTAEPKAYYRSREQWRPEPRPRTRRFRARRRPLDNVPGSLGPWPGALCAGRSS
ncbi:acyl-CoA synthetase (AMP-forming)/AMP-acid ligase II [Rhizobium leguminosarum]